MAHIRQIEPADATGLLRRVYDAGVGREGSVANIMKIMSLDPASCRASMDFYASLMRSENALDPPTRELLAAVVSCINDCFY